MLWEFTSDLGTSKSHPLDTCRLVHLSSMAQTGRAELGFPVIISKNNAKNFAVQLSGHWHQCLWWPSHILCHPKCTQRLSLCSHLLRAPISSSPPQGYKKDDGHNTHDKKKKRSIPVVNSPWLDSRCPPKPLYHSPSSAGQGRENITKDSWVKIRTGRDHSPVTATGKTVSTWGS